MKLAWIDLETTGLDPDRDQVLEVACIVTDAKFSELGRWSAVVRPTGGSLDAGQEPTMANLLRMVPVVREMHTANGLLALIEARAGMEPESVNLELARWLAFIAMEMGGDKGLIKPQLAGSTIDFDRAFLRRHLPAVFECLHYRNLDVSSFNEMAKRWWPAVYEGRPKGEAKRHRAMADIEESINVARYYASALGPVKAP